MSDSYGDDFERGRIHERVTEHGRRLDAINGSIDRAESAISGLRVDFGRLATRVGIYAAIAAGVAGIVGSIVAAFILKAVGGN